MNVLIACGHAEVRGGLIGCIWIFSLSPYPDPRRKKSLKTQSDPLFDVVRMRCRPDASKMYTRRLFCDGLAEVDNVRDSSLPRKDELAFEIRHENWGVSWLRVRNISLHTIIQWEMITMQALKKLRTSGYYFNFNNIGNDDTVTNNTALQVKERNYQIHSTSIVYQRKAKNERTCGQYRKRIKRRRSIMRGVW